MEKAPTRRQRAASLRDAFFKRLSKHHKDMHVSVETQLERARALTHFCLAGMRFQEVQKEWAKGAASYPLLQGYHQSMMKAYALLGPDEMMRVRASGQSPVTQAWMK